MPAQRLSCGRGVRTQEFTKIRRFLISGVLPLPFMRQRVKLRDGSAVPRRFAHPQRFS